MSNTSFREPLRRELEANALLLDAARFSRCGASAVARGIDAQRDVERLVGARTLEEALDMLASARAETDYQYVMGYGALMTEFLAAPVPVERADRAHLATLGALANLLVGYVDERVDAGVSRASLLPRWVLRNAMRNRPGIALALWQRCCSSSPRLVTALTVDYFRRVGRLSHVRRHIDVHATLMRTVHELYEAEARSPAEWRHDPNAGRAFGRKTPFPIVVLGLPAWLAVAHPCLEARARHLRWITRLGRFIRWIDDAADLDQDRASGMPNLVAESLARRGSCEEARAELAGRIAGRGRHLMDEWTRLTPADRRESCDVEVLPAIVTAWMGGPVSTPT